jgi:hypothetical protein
MTIDLEGLPVADDARDELDAWLLLWEAYIQIGDRYADAIAADRSQSEIDAIADEAALPQAALRAFADENGLPSCGF